MIPQLFKKNTGYTLESFLFCFVFKNKQTILRLKTRATEKIVGQIRQNKFITQQTTHMNRRQRESKVDTEIPRESQR